MIDDLHVKRELEAVLRRPLPPKIWAILMRHGDVRAYTRGQQSWPWLTDRAEELLDLAGPHTAADHPLPTRPKQRAGRDENELVAREAALTDLIAEEAGTDHELRDFRHKVLDNQLLGWEDIEQWIWERYQEAGPPTLWLGGQLLWMPRAYVEQLA